MDGDEGRVRRPAPRYEWEERAIEGETSPTARPGLLALTRTFALLGLTSLGGATFTYFYSEFVDRLKWLTHEEIMNYRAISQLLPGANMGNLAVLVGRRLSGPAGAAVALTMLIAPGAALMLILSVVYFRGGQIPVVTALFKGIGPAAAGLALANALEASGREVRSPRSAWLVPVGAIAVIVFHPPTLAVVAILGLVGVALYRPGRATAMPSGSNGGVD
jgi:chromate transporter